MPAAVSVIIASSVLYQNEVFVQRSSPEACISTCLCVHSYKSDIVAAMLNRHLHSTSSDLRYIELVRIPLIS